MGRMIGIDLGTTNSCVAVNENGQATIIPTRQGQRTLPSVVAYADEGQEIVGITALRQAVTNPHRTIHGIKRLIGRKSNDPMLEHWKASVPYEIISAPNGDAWVSTRDGHYSPQEISAIILHEIKAIAEEYLGEIVTDAVVTVPAYFNDNQRQATKDAGAIAGLHIKNILNEPTAAALGYGVDKSRDQSMAIFDLGGGTFDITIMRTTGGVFEVLASSGDTFLGGNDFDQALMEHIMREFKKEHGIDLGKDPVAVQRLKEAAETAKKELSSTTTTSINLPFICSGSSGPLHVRIEGLERTVLEVLSENLIQRLEGPCISALHDAGMTPADLDQVLLVGGMTRMPAVRRKVEEIFGKIVAKDVNPDEIVAIGAATQCAILLGELQDIVLLDVTPHSLGVRVKEERMSVVIDKNTTIPTSEKKLFATTRDNQSYVDIQVYQGEHEHVYSNTSLGQFILGDLPLRAAGKVNVEVTFLLDADGVLSVTARELTTDKAATVRIAPSSGLAKSDVERLTAARRNQTLVSNA
jgi:molecular chaperone DnaK